MDNNGRFSKWATEINGFGVSLSYGKHICMNIYIYIGLIENRLITAKFHAYSSFFLLLAILGVPIFRHAHIYARPYKRWYRWQRQHQPPPVPHVPGIISQHVYRVKFGRLAALKHPAMWGEAIYGMVIYGMELFFRYTIGISIGFHLQT